MSWGDVWDWVGAAAAGPGVLAAKTVHSGVLGDAAEIGHAALEAVTPIDEAWSVAEGAWDIGGGIYRGAHAGWDIGAVFARFGAALLSSPLVWLVVLALLALYLLQPVLRPAVRVVATPVRLYKHGTTIKARGVAGNVKAARRSWNQPEHVQGRQRRLVVPHRRRQTADKYAGAGDFAVIVGRTPPPPLEPRSVTVQASDFKAAERHLKAHLPKTYWLVERRGASPQNPELTLFHFRRRPPTKLERRGL